MNLELWIGDFARRFARSSRGNVAMIFALIMPVLVLITMGGVDISRASTVRINLQDALDAAALTAARTNFTTDADLKTAGLKALRANLQAYPNITLREDLTTFTLTTDRIVIADAKVDVDALVANIVLPPYGKFFADKLPVAAHSEVNRSSKNLEVSMVLDITGSMGNGKIDQLKDAATQLIDIVVKDQQTPYYSKMAIVPYSMGVNVDSYANAARGTPIQSTAITAIAWSGTVRTVTAATKANPAKITAAGHGFANGDKIVIWDSVGMTQLNGKIFTVASVTSSTFTLSGISSSSWNTFSGTAKVAKCLRTDCYPVVTSSSHGMSDGEGVYITGVGGMTQLNSQPFEITSVTASTFALKTVAYGAYTSGGNAFCGRYGCQWRVYYNPSATLRALETSKCVSERTGANAYNDTSPSSSKVGFNYAPSAASGNPCPADANAILPLTSSKSSLKSLVNGLSIGGSTAGQIGTAWGWYTVSPNFNSLWPSSVAGAYNDPSVLKAVILMTDGDFNTPYCSGVIAQDAGSGSGGTTDKINCNATNGNAFDQTDALCDAIKAKGIILYTVGFQVDQSGPAGPFLRDCATSPSYAYLPESGADLTEAFAAIGRDITRLRISK